jgi:putative MATE family efflux protein
LTHIPRPIQKFIDLYGDKEYFQNLFKLAVPIVAQQFIFAMLNMAGVMLLGQVGETAVAAVGLAGQAFFLLNLLIFGIVSGSSMFSAQYWGRQDLKGVHRVLGLCLALALIAALIFFAASELFPNRILNLYSNDPAVISVGANYLRLFAWTFIFYAVTMSYAFILRSIGEVKLPNYISIATFFLNTILMYGFIFGKLGLPQLGVDGVAIASIISRALECVILLAVTYATKSPVAASLRELTHVDFSFIGRFIGPVLPVILNEMLWSFGITAYNAIYGHISTDAVAAMNIVGTIDGVAVVIFIGISGATSIMVGNAIGAGREDDAYIYAGRSLGLATVGGILIGILIAFVKAPILALYHLPPSVVEDASRVLIVTSFFLWVRMNNNTIVVAILRAGGDTIFSLITDGFIIWLVGVPLAWAGAFIFHLPVYFVYLFAMSEEVTKWILGVYRFLSRKWIRNLAHST